MAAVALPSYQNYVERSKKLEARSALSAIYIAEKAYFAEHSRYDTFDTIGFEFGQLNNYKFIGFTAAGADATGTQFSLNPAGGAPTATAVGTGCTLTKTSFKAGAFDAAVGGTAVLKGHQIDEDKVLTEVTTALTCA